MSRVSSTRRVAHGALDFDVSRVPDEHDLAIPLGHAQRLEVDLRHEGAGGVDDAQIARLSRLTHGGRYAVGAEDQQRARRHVCRIFDEDGSLVAQFIHHVAVVDDLVAHVHRCTEALERNLDHFDRAVYAGAEAAGVREQQFHRGET
jgi:hypothetical protein